MAKHIGIVACSAEGAALCYRTICLEAASRMGEHAHPEITLNNISRRNRMHRQPSRPSTRAASSLLFQRPFKNAA